MAIIEIQNDKLAVGINTLGSELMYINSRSGTEFLWNGDECVWSYRAPVLFPICGGLKEDTYTFKNKTYMLEKHGFASQMEFYGKRINNAKAEFILSSDENTLKEFPFPFTLTIVFEVIGNTLKVSNIVKNMSDEAMYFSIGAHEGYSCPEGIEEYEIRFPDKHTLNSYVLDGNLLTDNVIRMIEDSDTLPLKYEYFAVDALVFKHIAFNSATLVHKNSGRKVQVTFDGADYFLLWTKPGAKYICLEPWHGVQDIVGSSYDITKKEGIIQLPGMQSYTVVHTIACFE